MNDGPFDNIMRDYDPEADSEGGDWRDPDPLPEGIPPVPVLDLDMVPDAFRPWIIDLRERMQVPPDFPAVTAVVEAGALIGRQAGVRPKREDDWLVIPNLFGMVVGRPSLLKTPSMREALKPIHELETEARNQHEEETRVYEAEMKVYKAEEKIAAKELEKTLKGDGAREQLVNKLLEEDGEPEKPIRTRYLCNDATVEKLGELLRDNPRGILLYRDELAGFLRGMERDGREQDRAFYLEAWDGGGRFTYDRIGRGTIEIDSCCVSIIGAICPAPLQAWVSSRAISGTGDDGLLQRFQLAVWPDSAGDFVNVDRRPDASAAARMKSALRRLATIGDDIRTTEQIILPKRGGEDDFVINVLRLDEAAQQAFDDWRERLEKRIREPDIIPAWESHLGKYRSLAPSLALIFHLLDHDSERIGLDAWLRAEAWVEYLEAHARRIYDGFLRPHVTPAHALARKIKSGALTSPFKLRDVYRPQWSGLTTRAEAELAVETLVDAGWLAPEDAAGPLGRPTVVYHIHPKCKGGAA